MMSFVEQMREAQRVKITYRTGEPGEAMAGIGYSVSEACYGPVVDIDEEGNDYSNIPWSDRSDDGWSMGLPNDGLPFD